MDIKLYDAVATRYSVRKYSDKPVGEDALTRLMEAARNAPSACNLQPWHFYVVKDEAKRKELFAGGQAWAAQAPVVIVACGYPGKAWVRRYDGKNHVDVDVSIAMSHIMLAAAAEGLGTCWIGSFDPVRVKKALGMPDDLVPVAITTLGYSAEAFRPHDRKPLDEIVTYV